MSRVFVGNATFSGTSRGQNSFHPTEARLRRPAAPANADMVTSRAVMVGWGDEPEGEDEWQVLFVCVLARFAGLFGGLCVFIF